MNNQLPIWFEVAISDPEATINFYHLLFEWEFKRSFNAMEANRKTQWFIHTSTGQAIGGFYVDEHVTSTSNVKIYIPVNNVEETLEKAVHLGGCVDLDKTKSSSGNGHYARFKDPEGNIMGIWSNT